MKKDFINLNGLSINNEEIIKLIRYGTAICNSATSEAEKIIDIPNIYIGTGTHISVIFTNNNNSYYTKLNVNNTGAKDIKYNNNLIIFPCFIKNTIYKFIFNGDCWIVDHIDPIKSANIYISQNGNDNNSGIDSNSPIKSLLKLEQIINCAVDQANNYNNIYITTENTYSNDIIIHVDNTINNSEYYGLTINAKNKSIYIKSMGSTADNYIAGKIIIANAKSFCCRDVSLACLTISNTISVYLTNIKFKTNDIPPDYNEDGYFSSSIDIRLCKHVRLYKVSFIGTYFLDGVNSIYNCNNVVLDNIIIDNSYGFIIGYINNIIITTMSGTCDDTLFYLSHEVNLKYKNINVSGIKSICNYTEENYTNIST